MSRVGVVVPVLDVAPWLDEMLASLRGQTFSEWTAVVVDDGSTDATLEIAARHAEADPRIAVSSNPERGPGARIARIHGRLLLPAELDYLYFPDGDDILEPRAIERLAARLDARPDAVAVFCALTTISEAGDIVPGLPVERLALTRLWARRIADSEEETSFPTLYAESPAWEGVTMFRRSAYEAAGGLEASPAWISHTTLDLLLRMSSLGPVVYVPERLYRRRVRPGQQSEDTAALAANGEALRRRWREWAADDPKLRTALAHGEFLYLHRAIPRRRLQRARALARRGRLLAAAPRVLLAGLGYRMRIPAEVRRSL